MSPGAGFSSRARKFGFWTKTAALWERLRRSPWRNVTTSSRVRARLRSSSVPAVRRTEAQASSSVPASTIATTPAAPRKIRQVSPLVPLVVVTRRVVEAELVLVLRGLVAAGIQYRRQPIDPGRRNLELLLDVPAPLVPYMQHVATGGD